MGKFPMRKFSGSNFPGNRFPGVETLLGSSFPGVIFSKSCHSLQSTPPLPDSWTFLYTFFDR